MGIIVRFMSLSGTFKIERKQHFKTSEEALEAVKEHASKNGYTNVKIVDEGDFDGFRYTAKTPGGRSGRNIAFADYDICSDCDGMGCNNCTLATEDN